MGFWRKLRQWASAADAISNPFTDLWKNLNSPNTENIKNLNSSDSDLNSFYLLKNKKLGIGSGEKGEIEEVEIELTFKRFAQI